MAHGVTTEWQDIHIKLGNYVADEKDPTTEQIEKIAIETIENYDPLAKKTVDQLKELEDDEDEEVLKAYQQKRLDELKELAKRPKYGKLLDLRKQDYIAEVTNAPKGVFVVLLLYQTYVQASNVLEKVFENLANKFPFVKFMKITATNCIEKFKDDDVPGVIIYKDGTLHKQFIPAYYYFGGKNGISWKSKITNYLFFRG